MQLQNFNYKPSETSTQTNLDAIQNWMVNQLAKQLSIAPSSINVTEPLTRYGLDSIDSVTIVGDLEDWLELELPSTLLWDYPTIQKAAQYLVTEFDVPFIGGTEEPLPTPEVAEEKVPAGKGWGSSIWGRINGN